MEDRALTEDELEEVQTPVAAKAPRLRLIVAGTVLLILVIASRFVDLPELVTTLLETIEGLGFAGILLFTAVYIAATVFLIPGSILTLGAGAVYGLVQGTMIVSIASTLGATAAFLVGRYISRDWVSARFAHSRRFQAIDRAVADEGWKIVGLLRLSPLFPFTLINYALGLTHVRLGVYVLASWICMIPGTLMYVYLGSAAGDLAALRAERHTRTPAEWALLGVGLVATIAVSLVIARIAKKALSLRVEPDADDWE